MEAHRGKRIRGSLLLPLFLLLSAFTFFCLLPLRSAIVIADYRRGGECLCVLPVDAGEGFSIRYIHSVNLSPVTDTLEWTGETLILRSSLFTSFGAGIPVVADGIGKELHNTEDGFLLSGIDKAQTDNRLLIMLQTVPDHHILYRNQEISLLDIAGSGALLELGVRRVPLAALWGNPVKTCIGPT